MWKVLAGRRAIGRGSPYVGGTIQESAPTPQQPYAEEETSGRVGIPA